MNGLLEKIGWQGLTAIATLVFGLGFSLVAANGLGATEFGRLSLAIGFSTIVYLLLDPRTTEIVIRFAIESYENKRYEECGAIIKLALTANTVFAAIGFLLCWLMVPFVPEALKNDEGLQLIHIVAVSGFVTSSLNGTTLGIVRVFSLFAVQTVFISMGLLLKVVIVAIVIYGLNGGSVEVAYSLILTALITQLSLLIYCLIHLRKATEVRVMAAPISLSLHRVKDIFYFGGNNYLNGITAIPLKEGDLYTLGWFATLDEIGRYRVAKYLMAAVWALSDPLVHVLFPEFMRVRVTKSIESLRQLTRDVIKVLAAVGAVTFVLCFFVVPVVIASVMGSEYETVGRIFRVMVASIIIWLPLVWCNPFLLSANRPDLVLACGIVNSSITIGLLLILTPRYGVYGAAFAGAFSAGFTALVSYAFCKVVSRRERESKELSC